MIWLYDRAICKDLDESFNEDLDLDSKVKVVEPEGAIDLQAQMSKDEVSYPVVCLVRQDNQIDTSRTNFTRLHEGVDYVIDTDANELFSERAVPVTLSYELHVITTNIVDMDELLRELIFKYSTMYFLKIELPYEGNRKIRFGVCIDEDAQIERTSGTYDYISAGKLYESILHLRCEGCVMVTYTSSKLKRAAYEAHPVLD